MHPWSIHCSHSDSKLVYGTRDACDYNIENPHALIICFCTAMLLQCKAGR